MVLFDIGTFQKPRWSDTQHSYVVLSAVPGGPRSLAVPDDESGARAKGYGAS